VKVNRSVPEASVIPELAYADVGEASEWLCRAFGFRERLRIGNHRAQLVFGNGAVIVVELRDDANTSERAHSLLVRVDDAQQHHDRAASHGARIVSPPTDFPYGERQYNAVDPGGHHWTFSESIADVDPATWGGTLITDD
jgi:uncharacterized glyoxalase superfamily protein PhnB